MLAKRLGLIEGFLGFLAGIVEAAVLSTKPLPVVFLTPDVQYPIWFIAPLAGLSLLGLVGTVLGAVADFLKARYPWTTAYLAALGGAIFALYMGAVLRLVHGGGKGLLAAFSNGATWVWFLSGLGIVFALLRGRPKIEAGLCSPDAPKLCRCIPAALGIGVSICVAGLAISAIYRSNAFLSHARATPRAQSPNIVLITLDTVRADHLSSYGYARLTTPHLDSFAKRGVLFENAVAPSSWTLASHASIFTGLLPHQHGANQAAALHPGPLTTAMVLASRGYETAGFSANLSYGFAGWGMSQGFELYNDDSSSFRHNLVKTLVGQDIVQPAFQRAVAFDDLDRRTAGQLNEDVMRWLERRSGRPYFLFINYYDAHLPYRAPSPFGYRFGRPSAAVIRETYRSKDGHLARPLAPEGQTSLIAGYDNCLAYLDDEVGKLVSKMATQPDFSHTVFVITSDHGEAFGEHGRYGHGYDLSREVLQVPLIIFGGGIPPGLRIRQLVRIRELLATLVDVRGENNVTRLSSLQRFWSQDYTPSPWDDMAISELVSASPDFRPAFISLVTPQWHFVHDSSGHEELYDWTNDVKEEFNLAQGSEHTATLEALRAQLIDRVGTSISPWCGPEYLGALDAPDFAFAPHALFAILGHGSTLGSPRRIGSAQAFLAKGMPSRPRKLEPVEEEILRSLPYQ